jgi:hypothetical protein
MASTAEFLDGSYAIQVGIFWSDIWLFMGLASIGNADQNQTNQKSMVEGHDSQV